MSVATMPLNLKLVLEYLLEVRELDRYLRREDNDRWTDVVRDLELHAKAVVRPALQQRLSVLASWHFELKDLSILYWHPDSWTLKREALKLCVILPHPLGKELDHDADPSVNLYAPPSVSGKAAFTQRSGAPKWVHDLLADGFALAADNEDWHKDYPLGKFVEWVEPGNAFDEVGLLNRIAAEAEKIVRLEPEIAETIRSFRSKNAQRRAGRRRRPT